MKAVVKDRAHPSIIAVKKNGASDTRFNFLFEGKEDILKERMSLQTSKERKMMTFQQD